MLSCRVAKISGEQRNYYQTWRFKGLEFIFTEAKVKVRNNFFLTTMFGRGFPLIIFYQYLTSFSVKEFTEKASTMPCPL